jgi:hypothetical protein
MDEFELKFWRANFSCRAVIKKWKPAGTNILLLIGVNKADDFPRVCEGIL